MIQQLEAAAIVLGRPREGTAVFDESDLQAFARVAQSQTGAEVFVL